MKNNSFCGFCGSPIGKGGCTCPEAVEKKAKKSKLIKNVIPIASVCIILAIAVSILIVIVSNSSKLDPLNYTEVSFDGYDGNGTVNVRFDSSGLITEILGEEPDIGDDSNAFLGEESVAWYKKYDIYEEGIDYEVSPKEGLSNGDEIEIKFTVTDSVSKKVKAASNIYIVSGLTEVEKVDIFEEINVSFEGVSGDGDAIVELVSPDLLADLHGITVSKKFNLSNGEVITLSINDVDYFAEKYNVVPTVLEKTITVNGLTTYVTSKKDLPMDTIKSLADRYIDETIDKLKDDSGDPFTYGDVEYYGSYLFVLKKGEMRVAKNSLRVIVCYERFHRGDFHDIAYVGFELKNIVIEADGSVNLEYEKKSDIFTTNIDGYLDEEKYTVYTLQDFSDVAETTNTPETAEPPVATKASETVKTPETIIETNSLYVEPTETLVTGNMTKEEIEKVEQNKISCPYCGNPRSRKHYSPINDAPCRHCGEMVEGGTCHDCGY